MPQGYVYESYHCPDCNGNLWWPGSVCPECKGKGKADFQTPLNRDGPPIKPQPWQIQSRSWNKQDREERAQGQWARDAAARQLEALYTQYRLQCIPYKLLALTAPVEYIDKELRIALGSRYKLVTRETLELPQGEIATAIISSEEVYRPNWDRMFDFGWRPAKPLVEDSDLKDEESNRSEQNYLPSEPEQPQQELSLDHQDLAEWRAYAEAEELKADQLGLAAQGISSTTQTDPYVVQDATKSKAENITESETPKNPESKWSKVENADKSFWKKLRKNIE